MNFDENRFKVLARVEILRCRPGDWNHALRVVHWIKKLGKRRKKLHLLISAAYIHDIGWKNIIKNKKKITLEQLRKFEKQANNNSKKYASDFLRKNKFSPKEIGIINRYICAADRHSSQTEDEAIIVDADNLSKLTITHLKEKYHYSTWEEVYNLFQKTFPKRIKTEMGKALYRNHLEKLKDSINKGLKKEFTHAI